MILVYIALSILCILLLPLTEGVEPFKDWATLTTTITCLHAILSIYVLRKVCRQWTSFPLLFLFGLFLFNYGQLWLYGFVRDFKTNMPYNKITIYPKDVYVTTCCIILSYISAVTTGVLLAVRRKPKQTPFVSNYNLKIIKRMGVIIIAITLPFNIYENALYIIASITFGYKEVFLLGIPSYISTLSWMSVMGVVCLLMGCPNKKNVILVSFTLLYGFEMVSGNRGQSVMAVLTLFMFYNLFFPIKLTFKKSIIYATVVIFGMIILSTVKKFRGYTEKEASDLVDVMTETSEGNPLYDNLDEFGGAIAFPSIVQMYQRATGNYLLGWTYISSFAGILPNIGIIDVAEVTKSGSMVKVVQEHGIYGPYESISASSVSETLFNFGIWGTPVFALFVGLVVGVVYKKLEKDRGKSDIIYYVMTCYGVLFWTRGAFGPLVRFIIWGSLFIYFSKLISQNMFNYKTRKLYKIK